MSELYNAWTGHLVRLRAVEPGDWERFAAFDQDSEGQRKTVFKHGVAFILKEE